MTPTPTLDIDALCAAIDSGDDSALPILADALEEAGDRRASGIRNPAFTMFTIETAAEAGFIDLDGFCIDCGDVLLSKFVNLRWNNPWRNSPVVFPTRSDAYLALAWALAD